MFQSLLALALTTNGASNGRSDNEEKQNREPEANDPLATGTACVFDRSVCLCETSNGVNTLHEL